MRAPEPATGATMVPATGATARRHTLGCLLACALLIPTAATATDTADWLLRINRAASSISFDGVLQYAHGDTTETMRVVRQMDGGEVSERIYSLNGEYREIVHDSDGVRCYLPAQNFGLHTHNHHHHAAFPNLATADLTHLQRSYRFVDGGTRRIAGRQARRIDVIANDHYRYGYRLWADVATGLLLRSDLTASGGRVIEKYHFTTIKITDQTSQPVPPAEDDDLEWLQVDHAAVIGTDWHLGELPPGYRLHQAMHRISPSDGGKIDHFILSDGLSMVSVFIRPDTTIGGSTLRGLTSMGAIHAYHTVAPNLRITALGEIPARTAEILAAEIARHYSGDG